MKLSISEVFYSIQGEGPTTGYPAVFVRLGGCNLMCGGEGTQRDGELHNGATWRCDTIEVWMKSKSKAFKDILPIDCQLAIKNGANIIITGGEPLMQQTNVIEFIKYVRSELNKDCYVEIETNGTIAPIPEIVQLVNQWNCSPKLANSGMPILKTYNTNAIEKLNRLNTAFKFVVTTDIDWAEITKFYFDIIDHKKIWLMPSGSNQDQLVKSKEVVAEIAKNNYIKFTNRLHIEIWNKKTGV
jgi:organic radical activating enzyme